jgi:hypothetical protein
LHKNSRIKANNDLISASLTAKSFLWVRTTVVPRRGVNFLDYQKEPNHDRRRKSVFTGKN